MAIANILNPRAVARSHRDGVGGIHVACIGNVCYEVTPLSQRLKAATRCVAILANLYTSSSD